MCLEFSCIFTKDGHCLWINGDMCHEHIIEKYKERYHLVDNGDSFIRVEIVPPEIGEVPFSLPVSQWSLRVDQNIIPPWWGAWQTAECRKIASRWRTWKLSRLRAQEREAKLEAKALKKIPTNRFEIGDVVKAVRTPDPYNPPTYRGKEGRVSMVEKLGTRWLGELPVLVDFGSDENPRARWCTPTALKIIKKSEAHLKHLKRARAKKAGRK
jgi:hypothetical protein